MIIWYETQSSLPAAFLLGRHSFNVLLLNFIFVALGLQMSISVCQRPANIGWPMSSWCKLANEKLISACQWAADVILANEQLMYDGQWAAGISRLINSWCKLANMQVTLVAQWSTKWSMSSWHWLAVKQLTTTVSQWAGNKSWAMSSWYKLTNEQLMSVDKWGSDLRWPICSWHQLANEKLKLFGQWLVSWYQLTNEQLIPICQWAADITWTMISSYWFLLSSNSWAMSSWYQLAN